MHFGSSIYQLRNYQRVSTNTVPLRYRIESSLYTRSTYSWIKGNQINKNDNEDTSIKLKIGGEDISPKKRKKRHLQYNKVKTTKYSILTFLPINLAEQLRRIANFYFLLMTIISLLIDSPVPPVTSLAPLLFVITVTATKQGYEDYLRHKADNIVNYSLVTVIRDGKECNIRCEKIIQGDLVVVTKDCDVPCDLVLLKSSDLSGKCHITTANLDGETNLKKLYVPKELPNVPDDQLCTLGCIECELPTVDLYSFNGKITLSSIYHNDLLNNGNDIPLLAENVLLRGSRVKNTDWIIGCAVYVGRNTKMALNSRLTSNKVPSSENFINKFLLVILIIQLSIVIFAYLMKRYYDLNIANYHHYLGPPKDLVVINQFLQDFLSFLILFNYLIPISLYVTIELHKFLGSFFLEWDRQLYDEIIDQPCIVNTSDLNEELGQVNILFSDKTGTLTKNEMYFQECSIKGKRFIYKKTRLQDSESGSELDVNAFNDNHLQFFKALAICHTVQVAIKDESDIPINETVQSVYTFNRIKEEISNGKSTETVADENDFVQIGKIKNNTISDNNPLLSDERMNNNNTNNNVVMLRNLLNTFTIDKKIYSLNESIDNKEENENIENQFSVEMLNRSTHLFSRSISSIDIPSLMQTKSTHRRTQSYGMQQSFSQTDNVTSSRSSDSLKRTMSKRESYAKPFYTQESLLMRKESTRRKKQITSVVEKLDYQSSSPDEKALIEAAANLGIIYTGEINDQIKIYIYPPHLSASFLIQVKKLSFIKLHVIEFTSDRKRMSVIVRDPKNTIWIYTKGAENYVMPLCDATPSELKTKTIEHVNTFANSGLRTLIIARRKLTEEEFKNFKREWNTANTSFTNRAELVTECYAKVERNLELLGATAVEDALQDDVADTLISLQEAGIKIWVLTGDKVETALNIALSCGHIPENASKYFITECVNEVQIRQHLSIFDYEIRTRHNHDNYALLIDGISLTIALKYASDDFAAVAIKCKAVLCCRLSPLQKCEVVQLIKKHHKNYITAAIGDGANDVSMIQEAHVGLGIVGKEGRQAASCADYSFSKFNMIKRLLLVHGHYHTYRLSMLVLYFFYKNIVFMGVQFLFQFHNMFSSETVFDSLFLTLYNITYTGLPILILSLTEKPFEDEVLVKNPKMYKKNVFNRLMHWDKFITWILFGFYHSIVCFYVVYYVWGRNDVIFTMVPYTVDLPCFGTIAMHSLVILVNMKLWIESTFQSYLFIGTVILSIVGFVLTTVIYNFIEVEHFQCFHVLKSTSLFAMSILIIGIAFFFELIWYSYWRMKNELYKKSIFCGV